MQKFLLPVPRRLDVRDAVFDAWGPWWFPPTDRRPSHLNLYNAGWALCIAFSYEPNLLRPQPALLRYSYNSFRWAYVPSRSLRYGVAAALQHNLAQLPPRGACTGRIVSITACGCEPHRRRRQS